MTEDQESLRVLLARIDENVQHLRERAEEDREKISSNAERITKLEGFRERALGIVGVVVLIGTAAMSMVKDALASLLPH